MPSAFVLAAGLGTRLRPLTDHVPKPLVPLGDRPVLDHVVARVATICPVSDVVVNAFHLADAVIARAELLGARAVREATLLGTAGGLRNAAPLLAPGPTLIWNADIVAEVDARALLASHLDQDAVATLCVAPRPVGEGTVGLDRGGNVVRLRGERFGEEIAGGEFLGVHVIGAALRALLPLAGCLVGDVYLPALRRGERLATFGHEGAFFDVGNPASYLAANLAWLERTGRPCWIGARARVSAASNVTRSIVGEDAVIEADLDACVVLAGAHVRAPASASIVTTFGTIDARASR